MPGCTEENSNPETDFLGMAGAGPSQGGPTVGAGTMFSAQGVLEGLVCDLLLLFAAHSDLANTDNVWAWDTSVCVCV